MIWTDGSSNQWARGVRIILRSPEGDVVECVVYFKFPTTNNESDYEAVLMVLDLAKGTGASLVVMHYNSQVVLYLSMVKSQVNKGLLAKFVQIPREGNEQPDCLAKAASAKHMVIIIQVLSFIQYSPAIDKLEV